MSVNLNAGGGSLQWYGTDFNPAQASFAQEISFSCGEGGAILFDDSFEELLKRSDELPQFDYICLHGIWSWISSENRHIIVELIRRKLKVGGVVYISYNCNPGWTDFAPLRHLMFEHQKDLTAEGSGIISGIGESLSFMEQFLALNPRFVQNNPASKQHFDQFKNMDKHYLAHEFFNQDWAPMYFSELASLLDGAKLSYACSATFSEHIDSINLTAEQSKLLSTITSPVLRETVRDFMANQMFRRDYWIRGVRHLSRFEADEKMRDLQVILLSEPAKIDLKVKGALGEGQMSEEIYRPLLEALSDHEVYTLGALEQKLGNKLNFAQLRDGLMLLIGQGHIYPAQSQEQIEKALPKAQRLNRYLLDKARSENIGYLCSPVLGGGFPMNRIDQLFLLRTLSGKGKGSTRGKQNLTGHDLAVYVQQLLKEQGQNIIKDGKVVEDEQAALEELESMARNFTGHLQPLVKRLQVV